VAVLPAARPPVDQAKRAKLIEGMKRRALGVWVCATTNSINARRGWPEVALAYAKKNRAQIVLP
jgi:hypothetical protein